MSVRIPLEARCARPGRGWKSRLSLALFVPLLAASGCSFEEEDLEDKRCLNDAACLERFGAGFVCEQVLSDDEGGFCEESSGSCQDDADCEDGLFCTVETCDPGSEGATAFGCVIGERAVDDGVDCTVDICDEAGGAVVNDTTACACTGTNDPRCDDNDPCTQDSCELETLTCQNSVKEEGTTCDDGVTCTDRETCDAEGQCVGSPNNNSCDDGEFCNGVELCDPQSSRADNEGCVGGSAPTNADDGVECTDAFCDEDRDRVSHEPTDRCQCVLDTDCAPADVVQGCGVFSCDADFTCQQVPGEFLDPDASCDDGVVCTEGDKCLQGGECRGIPIDALCPEGQRCDADAGCQSP